MQISAFIDVEEVCKKMLKNFFEANQELKMLTEKIISFFCLIRNLLFKR